MNVGTVSGPIHDDGRADLEPGVPAFVSKDRVESIENMSKPASWPLRELFSEHATFVAAFVRRSGVCEDDVDDCVQEVFLVVHRRGGYRPGPAAPRTWLAAIAVNVARNAIRKRARTRTVSDEEKVASALADGADPFQRAAAVEALSVMQSILDKLDDDQRSAFLLHEVHGETCASIAAGFGVPEATIRSRVSRAKLMLITEYEKRSRKNP